MFRKHDKHAKHKRREDRPVETANVVAFPGTEEELIELLTGASEAACPRTGKVPAHVAEEQNKKTAPKPIDAYADSKYAAYNDPSNYYVAIDEGMCIKNVSCNIDPWVDSDVYADDTTAMTDITQRGQIIYNDSDDLFSVLPARTKYAIDLERCNNSAVISTIMDLEAECAQRKYDIDMEYRRRIYETMFEFNTQARTHRDAVNMCVIVNAAKGYTSGNN